MFRTFPALLGVAIIVTVLVMLNGLVLGGVLSAEWIAVLVAAELLAGVLALRRARRRSAHTGTGAERPRR